MEVAEAKSEQLKPWRCPKCGKILAKLALSPGSIVQVKCGCNAMSEFTEPEKKKQ